VSSGTLNPTHSLTGAVLSSTPPANNYWPVTDLTSIQTYCVYVI